MTQGLDCAAGAQCLLDVMSDHELAHHSAMTEEEAQSRLWTVTESGVPLFLTVTLTIRPDRLDPFVDALRAVLPLARAEDACLYLNVGRTGQTIGLPLVV